MRPSSILGGLVSKLGSCRFLVEPNPTCHRELLRTKVLRGRERAHA